MIDHAPTSPAHPAQIYAQRLFRRVLANWVLDCSRLHRKGLLRPRFTPGQTEERDTMQGWTRDHAADPPPRSGRRPARGVSPGEC